MRKAFPIRVLVVPLILAACSTTPRPRQGPPGFSAGRADTLNASLFLIDDVDRFLEAVRAPGDPVRVNTVDVVSRGRDVTAFVAISGCAPNPAGVCSVGMDFEVLDPSGHLVSKEEGVPLWRDPPKPAPGRILFGEVSMTVKVAHDAPLGSWKVDVVIRDNVNNQSVALRSGFEVV